LPTNGNAEDGVQVKPAPAVSAVTVTPVGIVSTTVVGFVLATGPLLLARTVKVKFAPCAAEATLEILLIVKFGAELSVTVVVPVQRAAAGQPGSPVVACAVLVTEVVPVLVTVKVTTVALVAPAATPAVDTQLTVLVVPLPTNGNAEDGVQVKPAPAVSAVTVTPVGIVSTTVVGFVEATGPLFEAWTVKVKFAPCAALATLEIFVIVKFGKQSKPGLPGG
jgi:hypothetical protein